MPHQYLGARHPSAAYGKSWRCIVAFADCVKLGGPPKGNQATGADRAEGIEAFVGLCHHLHNQKGNWMSGYLVGQFVGALIATFLISRLLLWLMKRWHGGAAKLVCAHLLSALVSCALSAVGHGEGGVLDWSRSGVYVAAQIVWLIVDVLRQSRRSQVSR